MIFCRISEERSASYMLENTVFYNIIDMAYMYYNLAYSESNQIPADIKAENLDSG